MNSIRKQLFLLLLACCFCSGVCAQQFTTHAVKAGETLYSISQQYKVTPFHILKYNKELKGDAPIKPNMLLIIPLDAAASDTDPEVSPEITKIIQEDSLEVAVEPTSFRTHKVRRRETLFAITNRYDITEAQLKRYNPDLYAAPLKKGMRLQIPEYPEEAVETDSINAADYITYAVLPKETRWSIAHKYGITLDSLMVLNPDLPKTTSHLAIGQQLLLPKLPGSSIEEQEVQLYISYTVPPKMTLYSLSQEYDIESSEIVRLNPEIVEAGGLKEGMVIRLPEKKAVVGEVNTDNFVFYEVKAGQTIFSLTRKLELTYEELMALNPDLSRGLQAGMVLKLPVEQATGLDVKNALVLDKINLADSINPGHRPKLLFMLPFRLDRINLSDRELAASALDRSNAIKYSLGLYSGALVAIDSISELGISVDVKTFDTELDLDKTRSILAMEDLGGYNAIVGPLQVDAIKETAVAAYEHRVPVVAPLGAQGDVRLDNVFFSVPPDSVLRETMLRYMKQEVTDQNLIVIADSKSKQAEERIIETFPTARPVELLEEEENISIDIEEFSALLSLEKENWVFVETDNFKIVSSVSSILNSSQSDTTKVRMFTTFKNKAFENDVISETHLSNLNFTFPSVHKETGSKAFRRRYRSRFGGEPDRYAVRGFDLTYDLLLKLAYQMNLYQVSETIGTTEYNGNKFDYAKELQAGYYNTAAYIMMYNQMELKEIKDNL